MSATVGPELASPSPAPSGESSERVSHDYSRLVLLPGVLALLLAPMLGPLSMVLGGMATHFIDDWDTIRTVDDALIKAEIVVSSVLYIVALVGAVRLGRRYRVDRRERVANGARGWHIGSVVLLVILTAIPALLLLMLLALAMALGMLSSGL